MSEMELLRVRGTENRGKVEAVCSRGNKGLQ
jgi:hypothetical protein